MIFCSCPTRMSDKMRKAEKREEEGSFIILKHRLRKRT